MAHNIFLSLGYFSHDISFLILLWAIFRNKSAEGVSLITQVLYIIVFLTRYLDLFRTAPNASYFLFFHKLFYISASAFIVFLMVKVYARTREREKAWKLGASCLIGAAIAAYPMTLANVKWRKATFEETMWTLSIILESVCVLPQLLLLRQTTVPTVIDSYYLLALGLYRALYIPNWVLKALDPDLRHEPDVVSVMFGILQTALYLDFAWVYWTRQRVKLRGGGIVDSDDISRGWIIGSVLNRKGIDPGTDANDEESDPLAAGDGGDDGGDGEGRTQSSRPAAAAGRWGPRGISVSADDTLPERQRAGKRAGGAADGLTDPNAFEDDDDDDDVDNYNSNVNNSDGNGKSQGGGSSGRIGAATPSSGDRGDRGEEPENLINHQAEWQEPRTDRKL